MNPSLQLTGEHKTPRGVFKFVFTCTASYSRASKRLLSILPCVWRRKALWRWWISFARTGQIHKHFKSFCINLPCDCSECCLKSELCVNQQQLPGEENLRREHSSPLQRPALQTRVSQVTAQSQGSPSDRYISTQGFHSTVIVLKGGLRA